MDKLTMRILDSLVDDEEQLEEVFLVANFQRIDDTFYVYHDYYRLPEIVLRLADLEVQGLVSSMQHPDYPTRCGPSGRVYRLTENGRLVWESRVKGAASIYTLRRKRE